MGDWNGKVKCIVALTNGFTKNKIYEVLNGYIRDENNTLRGRYYDIDDLNDDLASQFKEVVKEISKPKLCEILGVEVDEKFKIKSKDCMLAYDYFVNDTGHLIQINGNFCNNIDEVIACLINEYYTIIKLPFYQFDEDEIITLKALWLNGYEYIVRDDDDDLWAYDGMPKEDDGVYDNETEWDYAVKLNSDLFQQVQSDIILDISLELSKIN